MINNPALNFPTFRLFFDSTHTKNRIMLNIPTKKQSRTFRMNCELSILLSICVYSAEFQSSTIALLHVQTHTISIGRRIKYMYIYICDYLYIFDICQKCRLNLIRHMSGLGLFILNKCTPMRYARISSLYPGPTKPHFAHRDQPVILHNVVCIIPIENDSDIWEMSNIFVRLHWIGSGAEYFMYFQCKFKSSSEDFVYFTVSE